MKPKFYLFDIESDNLLEDVTVVHCGVIYDLFNEPIYVYGPDEIEDMIRKLGEADALLGHNIISYDLPVFKKLYYDLWLEHLQQFDGKAGERVFDTMVMCRTIWPDIKSMDFQNLANGRLKLPEEPGAKRKLIGSHSLRAWGYRLNYFKGNADGEVDFATYTPEMLDYCKRDVLLNVRLLDAIWAKCGPWPEQTSEVPEFIWLEHKFYEYLEWQQHSGVGFDKEFADKLCHWWRQELDRRITEMREKVPDIVVEETFTPQVNNSKYGYVKGVPFTKRKVIRFNPRSAQHIVQFLQNKHKWVPREFTKPTKRFPKGQPAVTYDILKNLPYPEAKLLARIKLLMDRLKLVEKSQGGSAWLQCVKMVDFDEETGNVEWRIFGGIIHNGTPTARCRHRAPNLGNIPSPKAIWGKVCRRLFVAAKTFKLVGIDFDGLEMRCLAEALWDYDGGAFYRMAFFGSKEDGTDPHSLNRDAVHRALTGRLERFKSQFEGKRGRERAKTAFYAWVYGAYPKKLGEIALEGLDVSVGEVRSVGKLIQAAFYENIPGLKRLIKDLEKHFNKCVAERKWPSLTLPDGRPVPIRKKGAILNSLLQSLGAILSKLACVYKVMDLDMVGFPRKYWRPVLHVHDETQDEVNEDREILSKFVDTATRSFARTGEHFKFRVPIVGTADVGANWAETH